MSLNVRSRANSDVHRPRGPASQTNANILDPRLRPNQGEARQHPASASEEIHHRSSTLEALAIVSDPSRTRNLSDRRPSVRGQVDTADNVNGDGKVRAETRNFEVPPSPKTSRSNSRSTPTSSPTGSAQHSPSSEGSNWHAEKVADKKREQMKRSKSATRTRRRSMSGSRSGLSGAEELEEGEWDEEEYGED